MKSYFVLEGKNSRKIKGAVVLLPKNSGSHKKSMFVSGNMPELYHGMTIELELDGTRVTDYNLNLTEKNIAALKKSNIDTVEYSKILGRHKILKANGFGWNAAKMDMPQVYENLPFCDADVIHKELINDAQDPCRITTINKKIVETARRKRKISYKIEEYLSYFDEVEQEGAYQQLMISLKMMCLQASRYGFKNNTVYDNEMKQKEEYLKSNIQERISLEYPLLAKKEIADYVDTIQNSNLAQEQLSVLWCLTSSLPCIVTGGAGVGKTSVIKSIIDCYSMHYSSKHILLIAPTGKASRRLAEKTGMSASTIHKALRKNPDDNYVYYTDTHKLPHRLIIVDESSMIDTELMYDLLRAVDITSKVIFVGDHNQLYPVGYGEPFFDFLQTLKVYKLTINHRQQEGTDILKAADCILRNEPIVSGKGVKIEYISYQQIGDILADDENIQIISPYNNLNAQINAFLRKGEQSLNVGDKVMMTKNTKNYCNGDIGIITAIDDKKGITVDIEGKSVIVSESHTDDITLAYAITIHKMQGSESNKIIVFIPECDILVDRRMMYTAVTRAKKELEIYYYKE